MVDERAERLKDLTHVRVGRELPGDAVVETATLYPAKFAYHADVVLVVFDETDTACGGHFGDVEVQVCV